MITLGVIASAVTSYIAPPTVLYSTPANGETGVVVGSNINVYFSETVTGYDGSTVITKVSDSSVIAYTRAFYSVNNRLLINPYGGAATMLEPGTEYALTLTGGPTAIRSLTTGLPMTTTIISFTTAA